MAQGEILGVGHDSRSAAVRLVVEVVTSGLLVIKHRSESFGKFVNVAVLEGDEVKIVDEQTRASPRLPEPW